MGMKMLTPSEAEKLPDCKYARFGRCDSLEKSNTKYCVECLTKLIFQALQHEDVATAVHALHGLMDLLKEAKVI